MWLDFVTYLHHHGHEDKVPWYRGKVNIMIESDLRFACASGYNYLVLNIQWHGPLLFVQMTENTAPLF